MWKPHALFHLLSLFLLHLVLVLVSAKGSTKSKWKTLDGSPPQIIARGGFSGLFPDSSEYAFKVATMTSVSDLVVWCNVLLTKNGAGICFPDIKLNNASNIDMIFPNQTKVYEVNGFQTHGYFSVDYTLDGLINVTLKQGVYSRTNAFDDQLPILTVEDAAQIAPALWLNIENDLFFTQNKQNMSSFILSVSRKVDANYISSPEVNFLRSISAQINSSTTKLVFRFLQESEVEPSTNQTFGTLIRNLTFIKTFASGILVPKGYIWPVDGSLYLKEYTSLVSDAHREGLQVFASEFANDVSFSYNYSYDPVAEYLFFIDNGNFSVDGMLSDFPITPSAARDCFAHLGKNAIDQVNTLIISKCGSSGDYPPCTDLAYELAIADGADVLDCPVQMSKDGTPFCLSSINLIESTNAAQTKFSVLATSIPEIQASDGIFAFQLTWDEIKTLKPSIVSPAKKYSLLRNPKNQNSGRLVTLTEFLALAKSQTSLSGVMVIIEEAAYLAEKQRLDVADAVLSALNKASYDESGPPKVMIRSTNSSVLMKFKEETKYELVFEVDENIRDALDSAVKDIKKFSDSVVVSKKSVFPDRHQFLLYAAKTVPKLQSFNLTVYVQTFSNEFSSQAWDFFSDPIVEINTYVNAGANGVITDFPRTAARYKRNKCLSNNTTPQYMAPVIPGDLINLASVSLLPPAEAPLPVLQDYDVVEPPLPSISPTTQPGPSSPTISPVSSPPRNSQPRIAASLLLNLAVLVASLLFLLNEVD